MSLDVRLESFPDSFFPDDVCVTLAWPVRRDVPGGEVVFWLTPKERKKLRKALKDG
jgi:hypothetical protein